MPPDRPEPDLEPSLLTARSLLEWRRSLGNGAAPSIPKAVILTHQVSLFRALAPRLRTKRALGLLTELRLPSTGLPLARFLPYPTLEGGWGIGGRAGGQMGLACVGVGGPATAIAVEELAVLGVREVVAVDVAAGIVPGFEAGQVVVVERAFGGDGTSQHYLRDTAVACPDPALTAKVAATLTSASISHMPGAVWSTDAPYRETASELQRWRSQGAQVVDMETAALFASTAALGIAAAAVLVVADTLTDEWRPPQDATVVSNQLRAVASAVRSALVA